jgi:hypothetical protein
MVARLTELGATLVQWAADHPDAPLADQEAAVLAALRAALPALLESVVQLSVRALDPGVRWVARRCPRCDRRVRVQSLRPRQAQTRCGAVRLTRPWYHCRACGHGFSPADATLGLAPHARLSPGLRDWVVQLGTAVPYREAAALLGLLTGLLVAPDTVREQTTAAGTAVEVATQQAITHVQAVREAGEPVDPVSGPVVVETDGAMVRYRDGWHEVKIGVVGGTAEGTMLAPSFVAAREAPEQFGPRLLAEAARRGALDVMRWEGGLRGDALAVLRPVHVVGDGAPWIWNLAADQFGERTEVVDFYHAAEHVWAVARAVYGADAEEARVGATVAIRALRSVGPAPVRAALAKLRPTTAAAREVVRLARGYFATNAARMDYPAIAAQQLPIGAGAVEASAKHVIQHRMKRPGQRWSARGGAALCALRARRASRRPLTPFGSVLH